MREDNPKKTFYEEFGQHTDKVYFGNSKNPNKVESRVEFSFFGGEGVFSLKHSKDYSGNPKVDGNTVVMEDADDGFYAKNHDADTFKFGLILNKKPAVNSWTFELSGHEDLDFFYQPPLANENADGSTWEDNDRGGISTRPADANGSYAVYHKTKCNHILGQTNYATGKVAHIYRPKFVDANGSWTWADLNIDGANYKVTCPQSFLDSAVYPVKANDTIGYTTVGASTDNGNQDVFIGFGGSQTTMPGTSGTASAMAIAVWHATPAGNVKMCLYSDNGSNHPDARLDATGTGGLAVTRTTVPANSSQFLSGTITNALSASTKYWLCTNTDNNSVQYAYDSGTGQRLGGASSRLYTDFPPATAPTISNNAWSYSFFVTYTPPTITPTTAWWKA